MCAALCTVEQEANIEEALLDSVFFALSNPVRRAILLRLGEELLLVSELAAPFDISLQAVSRHIQVLVRAGLVRQERSGRVSRCSLDAASILTAAIWLNRYSKHWQQQFDCSLLRSWRSTNHRSAPVPEGRAGWHAKFDYR